MACVQKARNVALIVSSLRQSLVCGGDVLPVQKLAGMTLVFDVWWGRVAEMTSVFDVWWGRVAEMTSAFDV